MENMSDALELLKEQEPRVLTLEELEKHCAEKTPFMFSENAPVYIEYCIERPWNVRWGTAETIRSWLGSVEIYNDYGKDWRCWNTRPTDEQRKAVKWDA